MKTTEAQKFIGLLIDRWKMRPEEVAFRLLVSLNTVMRWRRGVQPQAAHLVLLKTLVNAEREKRKRSKRGGGTAVAA